MTFPKRERILRRLRAKRDGKPKVSGGGEVGSGWTPGQDGHWLLPDSATDPVEDVSTDGVPHWRPRRN